MSLHHLAHRRRALPEREFQALRASLLGSPLVGASTLRGSFEASRGFAVTFHGKGTAEVLTHFPALAPYLERTLGRPALAQLTPFWRRTGPAPNAWYLNVLLVGPGASVAQHFDVTLSGPSGVADAAPVLVSVLYLQVPPGAGGELVLAAPNRRLLAGVVHPAPNLQVHFRGDLLHEVRAFEGTEGLRASLVIEQYHFADEVLACLPSFHLDSRAGFGAYLAHHATRPGRTFELD